jgi:phosphoribosylamine---glycine ligase
MKVLLIGSGGREHALARSITKSPHLRQLFIAPGNPGMMGLGTCLALAQEDHAAILDFCEKEAIDLVVIGPEKPLVAGLADRLNGAGIAVFGPSKAAAQLEGSKDFTKTIAKAAKVPTADYKTVTSLAAARAYLSEVGAPIVVKYDGLMAGKGVTVALTRDEALAAVEAIYALEPAAKTVIEEKMEGEEVSLFCLVDGEKVVAFGSAQDHKRIFDGDLGPNTGGMGAYSPAPVLTPELERRAMDEIVIPTAREMARQGMPYRGVLFAGLMLTKTGPRLIEYNCRFGDPECQVLLLRLQNDLLGVLNAVAHGRLDQLEIHLGEKSAVAIVMASPNYPGTPITGSHIAGLDAFATEKDVAIFHAGTALRAGTLVADGGRVLNICATGSTLQEARDRAYAALARIDWPEGIYRKDIGARGLAHHPKKWEPVLGPDDAQKKYHPKKWEPVLG